MNIVKLLEPPKVINKGNISCVYNQRIVKNHEWLRNMKSYRTLIHAFFKNDKNNENIEYWRKYKYLFDEMDKKEELFKVYNKKWNRLICDEINKNPKFMNKEQ